MNLQQHLTPKRIVLIFSGLFLAILVVLVIALVYRSQESRQQAVQEEQFSEQVASLKKAYDKPVPTEQQLSQLPPDKQAEFTKRAAQYFGVATRRANGEPPVPLEVVGACLRQRNLELAGMYRDLSTEAIMARDAELKQLRAQIAEDCYARYSPDGKVPALFNRDKHNH